MSAILEKLNALEVVSIVVPEQFRKEPSKLPLRLNVAFELDEINGKAHTCSWTITASSFAHRYINWCTELYKHIEEECLVEGQKIIDQRRKEQLKTCVQLAEEALVNL